MIPTMEPYVPEIVRNMPDKNTKTEKHTMRYHLGVGFFRPSVQLSYNHIHAIGWNIMMVPREAPIRDTRS
jgi:hypothetical protein